MTTHDSKFWDRIAKKYYERPIDNPAAYEEKLRLTRQHLNSDMDLLEFGCGTGGTAIKHAPHVRHIEAMDISEPMLEIARRQAAEQGVENVDFKRGDIADFDTAPQSYDAILGLSILHLVRDPAEISKRAHRWLKPGGVFVTSTACIGDKMGWMKFIAPIGQAFGKMPYLNIFKEPDLLAFMTDAGFTIETNWRPEKSMAVFLICKKSE